MKAFIIYGEGVELKTKSGESWTNVELTNWYNNRTTVEGYELARFNNEKDAYKFFDSLKVNWYEQSANVGTVLLGEIYRIEEVELDDNNIVEIYNEEIKLGEYAGKD